MNGKQCKRIAKDTNPSQSLFFKAYKPEQVSSLPSTEENPSKLSSSKICNMPETSVTSKSSRPTVDTLFGLLDAEIR